MLEGPMARELGEHMKKEVLLIGLLLAGCATSVVKDSGWRTSIGTDATAGGIEYLDLNGLSMEWSASGKGVGFLYLLEPEASKRVWSFPGRSPPEGDSPAVEVHDRDRLTA